MCPPCIARYHCRCHSSHYIPGRGRTRVRYNFSDIHNFRPHRWSLASRSRNSFDTDLRGPHHTHGRPCTRAYSHLIYTYPSDSSSPRHIRRNSPGSAHRVHIPSFHTAVRMHTRRRHSFRVHRMFHRIGHTRGRPHTHVRCSWVRTRTGHLCTLGRRHRFHNFGPGRLRSIHRSCPHSRWPHTPCARTCPRCTPRRHHSCHRACHNEGRARTPFRRSRENIHTAPQHKARALHRYHSSGRIQDRDHIRDRRIQAYKHRYRCRNSIRRRIHRTRCHNGGPGHSYVPHSRECSPWNRMSPSLRPMSKKTSLSSLCSRLW